MHAHVNWVPVFVFRFLSFNSVVYNTVYGVVAIFNGRLGFLGYG